MDDVTKTLPAVPPTSPTSSVPSMSSVPNPVGTPSASGSATHSPSTQSSPIAPVNPKEQADALDQILKDLEKQYQTGDATVTSGNIPKVTVPPSVSVSTPPTPETTKIKEDPIISTAPKPMMTSGMKAAIGGSVTPIKPAASPVPSILPSAPESLSKPTNKPGLIQKIGGVKLAIGAAALVLAVGGLVTVNILVKQPQDLQQKAFTGASVNTAKILAKVKDAPANTDKLLDLTNQKEITTLYEKLTNTYAGKGDTEQQDINEPSARVKGIAYLKYDPIAVGTFVWLRIENLPVPNKKIVHVWVTKDGTTYVNVGTVAFVKEDGVIVAYSTFIHKDDLRTYKNLVFSYDTPQPTIILNSQPEDIVLTVNF